MRSAPILFSLALTLCSLPTPAYADESDLSLDDIRNRRDEIMLEIRNHLREAQDQLRLARERRDVALVICIEDRRSALRSAESQVASANEDLEMALSYGDEDWARRAYLGLLPEHAAANREWQALNECQGTPSSITGESENSLSVEEDIAAPVSSEETTDSSENASEPELTDADAQPEY